MNVRQKKLLFTIIEEYIRKVVPVASKFLTEKGGFHLSSATIRNEMVKLEKEGYLIQPHTSAGRIPTELGYNFYLKNLKESDFQISKRDQKKLNNALVGDFSLKCLAKILAELSGEAVILAFNPKNIYYTGLSNLFAKPEFRDLNLIYRIGEVVDQLDEIVNKLFEEITVDFKVMIGKENPFGSNCSAIVSKFHSKNQKWGMMIILGPMRMDYGRNIGLLKYAKILLEQL